MIPTNTPGTLLVVLTSVTPPDPTPASPSI